MANDNIQNKPRKRFILKTWHIVVTLIGIVIVTIIAMSSYYVWDRWERYDDHNDIQGQWYVFGTSVPIRITADLLDFNADTSYHYVLDAENKTITFSLGNMEGMAHYCFYEDRQVLVLIDGKDFTRWGTAAEDLLVSLQEIAQLSSGRIPQYPDDDNVIILARTPDKFGWGDYRYVYKTTLSQSGDSNNVDKSNNSSQSPSKDQQDTGNGSSGSDPSDPQEGEQREDDPFGVISDTLMDEVQAHDDESGEDSRE